VSIQRCAIYIVTSIPYRKSIARGAFPFHTRDVITFIRNGWGNGATAVTAAQVAKLRKTTDTASDRVIMLQMR
jgi:hypothetical protein